MSSKDNPPSPQQQPQNGSQKFDIKTGNDSPVSVTAPQAHATGGGTANANVTTNEPPEKPNDHPYTVVIAVTGIVALVVAVVTLYFTVFPHK